MKVLQIPGRQGASKAVGRTPGVGAISRWIGVLALFAAAMVLSSPLPAQTATGQFNGHITDPTGAVVRDAKVTIVDTLTGVSHTTATNGEGLYTFPLLPPGEYTLSVVKAGFEGESSKVLELTVNQNVTQDFKLVIGQANETVTVSST
jgi:hypothetical protein